MANIIPSFSVDDLSCHIGESNYSRKVKSINHKGARALRNSPVGYFSEVARLQGRLLHKNYIIIETPKLVVSAKFIFFVYFASSLCTLWLKRSYNQQKLKLSVVINQFYFSKIFLACILKNRT